MARDLVAGIDTLHPVLHGCLAAAGGRRGDRRGPSAASPDDAAVSEQSPQAWWGALASLPGRAARPPLADRRDLGRRTGAWAGSAGRRRSTRPPGKTLERHRVGARRRAASRFVAGERMGAPDRVRAGAGPHGLQAGLDRAQSSRTRRWRPSRHAAFRLPRLSAQRPRGHRTRRLIRHGLLQSFQQSMGPRTRRSRRSGRRLGDEAARPSSPSDAQAGRVREAMRIWGARRRGRRRWNRRQHERRSRHVAFARATRSSRSAPAARSTACRRSAFAIRRARSTAMPTPPAHFCRWSPR